MERDANRRLRSVPGEARGNCRGSSSDRILETKQAEIAALDARGDALEQAARERAAAGVERDLRSALVRADRRLAVIAEIKRRSPSKGALAPDLDPAATARAYADGGAAALSVLTDREHFGGSLDDLAAARAAVDLPVLRKDFVVDELQVYETRAVADAVLLIAAAIPDDGRLRALHALAVELGLAVLVEAHDAPEIDRALAAGARIVGVNARDLGTFAEDLSTPERLAGRMPEGVVAVAESAIRSAADAARMAAAGFDAVLVGEMLVRSADPAATLRDLAGSPVAARTRPSAPQQETHP